MLRPGHRSPGARAQGRPSPRSGRQWLQFCCQPQAAARQTGVVIFTLITVWRVGAAAHIDAGLHAACHTATRVRRWPTRVDRCARMPDMHTATHSQSPGVPLVSRAVLSSSPSAHAIARLLGRLPAVRTLLRALDSSAPPPARLSELCSCRDQRAMRASRPAARYEPHGPAVKRPWVTARRSARCNAAKVEADVVVVGAGVRTSAALHRGFAVSEHCAVSQMALRRNRRPVHRGRRAELAPDRRLERGAGGAAATVCGRHRRR